MVDVVGERAKLLGMVIVATRESPTGPLVYLDPSGAGGGGGGEVTQGTVPWVISGALTEAEFEAIVGAVEADPTQYTLQERLKLIGDLLSGSISVVPRDSGGTEIGTSSDPIEVRQAALAVGVDRVGGADLTVLTTNFTSSGNNTVVTPASGKAIRLWAWSAQLMVGTVTNLDIKAGNAGTVRWSPTLSVQYDYIARSLEPNYWQLPVDTALVLNLSAASDVNFTYEYEEITP